MEKTKYNQYYRACPFCREYPIPIKNQEFRIVKTERIKKYRRKIRELREKLLMNNLIISQEEYGLCEKINWGGKTYF